MKKILTAFTALLCCGMAAAAHAEGVTVEKFTHQNVVGNQTCYGDDTAEKDITALPDVVMGLRINNPVIRAYLKSDTAKTVTVRAEQYSKFGKLLKSDEQQVSVAAGETKFEFKRVRNAQSVKLYADGEYIGGVNDSAHYENGMAFTEAPSDYQIYQRGADNKAKITIAGTLKNPVAGDKEHIVIGENSVTVNFDDAPATAAVIVAEYNDDNTPKNICIKEKNEGDSAVTVTSETPYGKNMKVMVWDSITGMKPIAFSDSTSGVTVSAVNKATNAETTQTASGADSFKAELTLDAGLYDISVKCADGTKEFKNVGVGDVWVAAGQSNMTDMGAITDGFAPDKDDPINDNMHIIYAEDTKWQQMSHPAGEGRFFKTGTRTSPVTSFAREIAAAENVPVGIVQSSVGGTNIFQWAKGVKPGDAADGYLLDALKSCFDNMPSKDIKGILWYQGCNDAITESYAYNYEDLERTIFSQMREFFGENTPIITTQINDANQDSTSDLGYYDAWSYVKDVQRRNPELFDNVYVVGTGALDLGDTIHNSAKSNPSVGGAWAKTALSRVYGHKDIQYLHPTIDSIDITDAHTLTLTFKNVGKDGLFVRSDKKRLDITRSNVQIQLGDLKKEFTVRQGGVKEPVASNTGKGETLTITGAELKDDLADGKQTVVLTVSEEMAGTVAVDCCYGKRFVPSLTDKASGWSVLAFYNVQASWGKDTPVPAEPDVYKAADTALISQGAITAQGFPGTLSEDIAADTASDKYMYLNYYSGANAYPFVKFDLTGLDTAHVQSARLRIYTNEINKDRNGNITVYSAGTNWSSASKYSDYAAISADNKPVREYTGVNTSTVFPAGNYSDIDVTDYIASLKDPTEAAFSASATHTSVALMSGVNSENPPQLVIQQGRRISIAYVCGGAPAEGVVVTVYGTGATEYAPKSFTTDGDGRIEAVLSDGTYRAVTQVGKYLASENRFTVESDGELSYTLSKNEQIPSRIELGGGSEEAAAGTSTKPFTAKLYDAEDNVIEGAQWSWSCDKGAAVADGVVTIPVSAKKDDIITLTVSATFNGVTVSATAEIKVIDIAGYGFGSEYVEVKPFTTANVSDVAVGNSGLTVRTEGSNYSGVFIRSSSSPNSGYYPYTSGFKAENDAYYLFAGAGGNNNSTVITLKLAKPISAGQKIDIKLAKPRATNKNGTDRTAGNNALTVVIGSKTIDLQNDYTFDEWKTESFTSDTDVTEIKLNLAAWCAAAIESISIDGGDIPVVTPSPAVDKIKIMPLGDSITNGFSVAGAYRNRLGELLVTNGLSEHVDFVGSQNTGSGYDNDNEGHSGWAIDDIPKSDDVEGKGRSGLTPKIDEWMDTYKPDIVLLQIGTNDILSLYDLDNAPARLKTLVDKILLKLPEDGKLYIAKIPYISETARYNNTNKTQTELDGIVDAYNTAVAELAAEKDITLADINSVLTLSDLADGIHPNAAGYAKMGELWYDTLSDEIQSRIN